MDCIDSVQFYSLMDWRLPCGTSQGISYELNKHAGSVAGIGYLEEGQELLSLGQDGLLVAWDMTVKRKQVCGM